MKDNFQNFVLSILFGIGLPLICFLVDYMYSNPITDKSVLIFLAIYSFTLIMSTKQKLFFGMYMIAGLIFALAYGAVKQAQPYLIGNSITYSFVGLVIPYLIERYQVHFINNEPFFLFTSKNK